MLAPGSQFGRYEIHRKLGRGGMGTVYVAHDALLGRMVAIKVFQSDLDMPDAAERFMREARSAAALNHPSIVTIHDFGEAEGRPFLVMEYVQGETLAEVIKRKASLPLADKLLWLEDLCTGAAFAHRTGVVHRDIKPTNLMVNRSGRLKILDFGIARLMGAFTSSATALVGTAGYMAPEQITGAAVSRAADIFSIGVVAYELLTYTEAFPGENTHAITYKCLSQDVTPLEQIVPAIPPVLAEGVQRALKKLPDERFADADELRVILENVRRGLEGSRDVVLTPTVLMPRSTADVPSRATPADSRPSSAGGPKGSTPSALPATDREALARRRATQIEEAVARGRAALLRGELEVAHEECLHALMFDDAHPGAVELEVTIKGAVARQQAAQLLDDARENIATGALTKAQEQVSQARELDPDAAELRRVERDVRLARAEQERLRQRAEAVRAATEAAEGALRRHDVETALALARQVLELEPDHGRARGVEAEALRILDADTGVAPEPEAAPAPMTTVIMPTAVTGGVDRTLAPVMPQDQAETVIVPGRKTPVPPAPPPPAQRRVPPPSTPRAPGVWSMLRTRAAAAAGALRARPAPQQRLLVAGAAGAALIGLAVLAVAFRPAVAPVMSSVVIDAAPFATVTALERADGTPVALPPVPVTPLTLPLPVGSYRVHLAGPEPEGETRVIAFDLAAQEPTVLPVVPLVPLTPSGYFEQYLSVLAAPAADDVPIEAAADGAEQGAER